MGENNNKKFPDYYPESCPPIKKSLNNELKVYRIVESNSIKPRDFVPTGVRKRLYSPPTCNGLGLSVLCDPADVHIAHKFFSEINMKKRNKVAVGYITRESGVYAHEPSENVGDSHINWWTYVGVEPHKYFTEVLKIGVDI